MPLWPRVLQILLNPLPSIWIQVASRHFTHLRDWFIEYTPFKDSIIFGGGEEYIVVGRGNVQIHSGGRSLIFLDVYFVSGMELNLLLVSQIMTHSPQLDIVFIMHTCNIVHRETRTTVVQGLEDHGLYRLVDFGDSQEHAMAPRVLPSTTSGISVMGT